MLGGEAAAICTDYHDADKALRGALSAGHESVIEHAAFTFRIEGVSRALLTQITRHRLASFSVESQRHVDMSAMPCVTPPAIAADPEIMREYNDVLSHIKSFYQRAVSSGIDKEDARFVLPNACETRMIMTMNARELRHFFSLRCCNRAQWEIRALADEMLRQCKNVAPALFDKAGPGCVRGRCPEGKRRCEKPRG
jgi:thymidylate synthase (FAD)